MSSIIEWWSVIVPVLSIVALVLALGIILKAIKGYRQNNDSAMFLLAVGLFLLVLAPLLVEATELAFFDVTPETEITMMIAKQLLRIAGLGLILISMYVQR